MLARRLLVLVALLALPSLARAEAQEDVIVTRDGAILHGHISELRPGKSATIVLLDGSTRTIQWGDIARSSGPSFPEARKPEDEPVDVLKPGPGRVPFLVESAGAPQRITLHVDSGVRVNGFAFTVSAELCRTPCTLYLPPGTYGVESHAEGVVGAFTVAQVGDNGGHLKLKAKSSAVRGGGIALVAVGAAALLAGGITMAMGPLFSTGVSLTGESTYDATPLYIGGGATMGAGAVMIVAGSVMIAKTKGGAAEEGDYEKRPASPTLQVNAAPLRDGGWLGATVRF